MPQILGHQINYTLDERGEEVDQRGNYRWAIEAWAEHGIYPPPPLANPNYPEVVAHVKARYAKLAKLPPEEQEAYHRLQHQVVHEMVTALAGPATQASSSS